MTRTAVVKYAQLTRIADQLRRNAEDLASSTNPPTLENCRIAGAMVGWAFKLVSLRMPTGVRLLADAHKTFEADRVESRSKEEGKWRRFSQTPGAS